MARLKNFASVPTDFRSPEATWLRHWLCNGAMESLGFKKPKANVWKTHLSRKALATVFFFRVVFLAAKMYLMLIKKLAMLNADCHGGASHVDHSCFWHSTPIYSKTDKVPGSVLDGSIFILRKNHRTPEGPLENVSLLSLPILETIQPTNTTLW